MICLLRKRGSRSKPTGTAKHARPWMAASATEKQSAHRHAVTSPPGNRSHEQNLVECDLAACDRAPVEPVFGDQRRRKRDPHTANHSPKPRERAFDGLRHIRGEGRTVSHS